MTPLFVTVILVFAQTSGAAPPAFDVKELASYRLTAPVFKLFVEASRRIAEVTANDAAFADSPLFTKEITLSGDAPKMAAALEAQLQSHLSIAQALHTAKISAREYTRFTLALLAARLAHGFIGAGVLRTVPAGVATDNVTFVERHHVEIAAVLKALRIES